MDIFIPDGALYIIKRLEESGNSAYIVGGAVRDALMGRVADDFDITTSMNPDGMKALFSDLKTVETGIKHGTLTVLAKGGQYEVTTYRIDGDYNDFRRPGSVLFTDKIEEDLARRDFTVNAIAYSPSRGICDSFGGMADIESGVIRAVGDAEVRFSEDALRIMRAIRFSSVLGFAVEESTKKAIFNKLPLLSKVSRERIFTEWKKLLSGKNAYAVLREYQEVIASIIPEISGVALGEESSFDKLNPTERMIYLYTESGPNAWCASLDSLKADNGLKKFGKNTLLVIDTLSRYDEEDLARCFAKYTAEEITSAISVATARACGDAKAVEHITRLLSSALPKRLSELAVSGDDILSLGFKGERVGKALTALHIAVIMGIVENKREDLISYAQSNEFSI